MSALNHRAASLSASERRASRLALYLSLSCTLILFIDLSARSITRWYSVHNQTFDLAFYMRIAWGLTEGDLWNPLVGASIWGLRISPVLYPLGELGRVFGMAPTLLIAQAIAVAGAGWLMSRIVTRRFGVRWAWLGPLSWALYPHLGHVATYEFHPGTLALLPFVWMIDAYDRSDARSFFWGAVGVILCREDFTLILIAFGVMVAWTRADMRRVAALMITLSALWFLGFTLILHPHYAPPQGSMILHFGHWGATVPEALGFIITHPEQLWAHLTTSTRLFYLVMLTLPLSLTPLLSARWMVPILPTLAMNLLSQFPSTTGLDSHYLTPALPFLMVAGLEGLASVCRVISERHPLLQLKVGRFTTRSCATTTLCVALWVTTLGVAHRYAGGTPLAVDYPASDFKGDVVTRHAREMMAQIAPHHSVQAPDRFTPHLATRAEIYRSKATPQAVDRLIIDRREPKHQHLREYAQRHGHLMMQRGRFELWTCRP